ncbi:MAG: response regulator [Cytophagales bacterium]|nr:response regulator [Cytophagales bacterium]
MSKKKKFLVVDDDEIFLFTANYVLSKLFPDMEIITRKNGKEALAQLKNESPDAMFIDLNMPVMDGWEVLENLSTSNDKSPFPIIIVTSSIDPSDIEKANRHPFKPDFVEKPLSEESFGTIKSLLS